MNHAHVAEARAALTKVIGHELAEIVQAIASDPADEENDYFVFLPERYTVDSDITELMGLVARTANSYHRIARLCGMARAERDLAEGVYKHKYKVNRVGKSDAERDKSAAEATAQEWETLLTVEAIYNMAEKLETIARIKSESTRKILDKVQAMSFASNREERGDISSVKYSSPRSSYSPY